jgi:hypothetical protein
MFSPTVSVMFNLTFLLPDLVAVYIARLCGMSCK